MPEVEDELGEAGDLVSEGEDEPKEALGEKGVQRLINRTRCNYPCKNDHEMTKYLPLACQQVH